MSDSADLLGPIDYLVVAFPDTAFHTEVVPAVVRLIADGTVRVLDLAFVAKGADGQVAYGEIEDLDDAGPLAAIAGFLSDLVTPEDLAQAAAALSPGSSAVVIVWENTWAAPFVRAMRGSGGEVVASGRIPASEVLDLVAAATDQPATTRK